MSLLRARSIRTTIKQFVLDLSRALASVHADNDYRIVFTFQYLPFLGPECDSIQRITSIKIAKPYPRLLNNGSNDDDAWSLGLPRKCQKYWFPRAQCLCPGSHNVSFHTSILQFLIVQFRSFCTVCIKCNVL